MRKKPNNNESRKKSLKTELDKVCLMLLNIKFFMLFAFSMEEKERIASASLELK
jgi:hypothetical protein